MLFLKYISLLKDLTLLILWNGIGNEAHLLFNVPEVHLAIKIRDLTLCRSYGVEKQMKHTRK